MMALARCASLTVLALGMLACGGIEGSPIGTAGQAGTETSTGGTPSSAEGDTPPITMTGANEDGPSSPDDSAGDGTGITSLGLDGTSTGERPEPPSDSSTGGGGGFDASTTDDDLLTGSAGGSSSGTETDTDTDTSSGTDTGTGSSSGG